MHQPLNSTRLLILIAFLCCPLTGWAAGNCSITASGVAFGTYNPLSSNAVDSSGSVQVSCEGPNNTVLSFSLSIPGTDASHRYMNSTDSQLQYNLYTDASRTQVWGDGTNGTAVIPGSVTLQQGHGTVTSYIYGRIFGAQRSAKPGSYSTQLIVTITF